MCLVDFVKKIAPCAAAEFSDDDEKLNSLVVQPENAQSGVNYD